MSQRSVESLIGRLLTDDELRTRFLQSPSEALQGWEFLQSEIDALLVIDRRLWLEGTEWIPSRLRRCSLPAFDSETRRTMNERLLDDGGRR